MSGHHNESRVIDTFALISVMVIVGVGTKWYQGLFQNWVNHSLSGVIYEIFWCLMFSLPGIWKKMNIAVGVFVATCVIELLQLWHLPLLMTVRSYQLGGYLLGSVFQWSDFPYYALGSWLGYKMIKKLDNNKSR